ncbi:unnamed protein product [Blepharisma stoltei]|uniref:Thioredoxin domain-containing protein n=1 Tax=Blepharisma stoltei TaxID=1481888 RepID=A0AAU9JFJ9_9CILI|nr:unnamed protein product [Blepharisma stoltei]
MLEQYEEAGLSLLQKAWSFNISKPNIHYDLYLSLHNESKDLVSTFTGIGNTNSYNSFLSSLSDTEKPSQLQIDFSPQPNTSCPILSIFSIDEKLQKELDWTEKPNFCLIFWGSWSNTCKKSLEEIEGILEKNKGEWDDIEIIGICLDDSAESVPKLKNVKNYWAKGFQAISDQGLEISEIPACLFIRNGVIIEKRDPTQSSFENDINFLRGEKPLQLIPHEGLEISSLSIIEENGGKSSLSLDWSGWYYLVLFYGCSESDSFIRQLREIRDEHAHWEEKLKIFVFFDEPIVSNENYFDIFCFDENSLEIVSKPGLVLLLNEGKILWKGSTHIENIGSKLKFWLDPVPQLTNSDYELSKKQVKNYMVSWKEKYPHAPFPSVLFTFSKGIYLFHSTPETHSVTLTGKYLQKYKHPIEEFFNYLSSIFPGAKNYSRYDPAHPEIQKGISCSFCNENIIKNQFLCLLCEPKIYLCPNCESQGLHVHPLYILTENSSELDEIRWGYCNVLLSEDQDGDLHKGVCCDGKSSGCSQEIRGIRWKCAHCPDYDLCSPCFSSNDPLHLESSLSKGHYPWHIMMKIPLKIIL